MSEMRTSPRHGLARKLVIDLSIMTVIGIVMALIGPFGSFEQPLSYRLVSWLGFAYLGYVIYSPMGSLVDRVAKALDLPRLALWVAGVAIATIPMTAAVWSIGFLPGPIRLPTLEEGLTSYFYVFIVGGGVTALFYALESRSAPTKNSQDPAGSGTATSEPPNIEEPQSRFLERLPLALGTNLIALEMEDHYVRAHTDLGSDLILLRMRDAVAELDGIEGAQVHRSWWVARGAVEGTRREGRNVRLNLTGGLEAPVSRANVAVLKEEGWF